MSGEILNLNQFKKGEASDKQLPAAEGRWAPSKKDEKLVQFQQTCCAMRRKEKWIIGTDSNRYNVD